MHELLCLLKLFGGLCVELAASFISASLVSTVGIFAWTQTCFVTNSPIGPVLIKLPVPPNSKTFGVTTAMIGSKGMQFFDGSASLVLYHLRRLADLKQPV